MKGLIVNIPDHPTTGHKRKVEIIGHGSNMRNEVYGLETECVYYENVNGEYGDPVSIPMPIVIQRTLVARTSGGPVSFVKKSTGEEVERRTRIIEEPIPAEEQEEGGPTTREVEQEYWVLKLNETVEVPVEEIDTLFAFLVSLESQPTVMNDLFTNFVLAEAAYGTYDAVGR